MNILMHRNKDYFYIVSLLLPVFLLYQMSFCLEYSEKIKTNPKSNFNSINYPVHSYVPEESGFAFLVISTNNRNITNSQRYLFPGHDTAGHMLAYAWKTLCNESYLFHHINQKSAIGVWMLGGHSPPA